MATQPWPRSSVVKEISVGSSAKKARDVQIIFRDPQGVFEFPARGAVVDISLLVTGFHKWLMTVAIFMDSFFTHSPWHLSKSIFTADFSGINWAQKSVLELRAFMEVLDTLAADLEELRFLRSLGCKGIFLLGLQELQKEVQVRLSMEAPLPCRFYF